jgi:hypothetical protein
MTARPLGAVARSLFGSSEWSEACPCGAVMEQRTNEYRRVREPANGAMQHWPPRYPALGFAPCAIPGRAECSPLCLPSGSHCRRQIWMRSIRAPCTMPERRAGAWLGCKRDLAGLRPVNTPTTRPRLGTGPRNRRTRTVPASAGVWVRPRSRASRRRWRLSKRSSISPRPCRTVRRVCSRHGTTRSTFRHPSDRPPSRPDDSQPAPWREPPPTSRAAESDCS